MLNSVRLLPSTALLVKPHLVSSTRHLLLSPRTTNTDSHHLPSPCSECVKKRQQHRTLLTPNHSRSHWRWRVLTTQQTRTHCGLSPSSFLTHTPSNQRREQKLHCGNDGEMMQSFGKIIVPLEQTSVDPGRIKDFLAENEMVHSAGHTCIITTCPRLTKRRLKLDTIDRLFINMTTGYFVCHACKKGGSWEQLQDNVSVIHQAKLKKLKKQNQCFSGVELDEGAEVEKARSFWADTLPLEALEQEQLDDIKMEFGIEDLTIATLKKYDVHTVPGTLTLVFPTFTIDGSISGVRITTHRLADPETGVKRKVTSRTIPRVDFQGLFGWNTVRAGSVTIVLTSSELDAMAVHQATKVTAVSLPKGISTLPQNVLPLLEQFTSIRLWLGEDLQSWAAAKQFSQKLSEKRCFLIRPDGAQPSPLASLRQNVDLNNILTDARPVVHKSIVTFRQLRRDVYGEFAQADTVVGIKWRRFPRLNDILKGHRRGELTVFTGPTGSGKTTFISDYSLDLCQQGVNTLWGSFEINNVRLLKTMLSQFSRVNFTKRLSEFDMWANQFELLPMYFMTFHGEENIRKVIETMSHAVYVHDITHVIVDNLQFMMGSGGFDSQDKYSKQDVIISAFRKFATQKNCHVTLVIHPRKERETDELTLSSIFGTAKATQEADNVMILQDRRLTTLRGRKYLQIVKNRYDGDQGVIPLKFDKDSLSFATPQKSKADTDRKSEKNVRSQSTSGTTTETLELLPGFKPTDL